MLKKLSVLSVCLVLLMLSGCKSPLDEVNSGSDNSPTGTPVIEKEVYYNPLTGEETEKAKISLRPVAIMINNIKIAQSVQTGVNRADIIYETEVEGGVTRLMAVYKDVASVGQIGTVRSARYPYVDLALGHDAVYVHCGQDPTYCAPHLKDIDSLSVETNKYAKRIKNGLATEHTLYTFGDTLWEGVSSKFKATANNTNPWVNFAAPGENVTLDAGTATTVSVPFPNLTTSFTYDSASGLYTRLSGGSVCKDYVNGETTQVKNVFVLLTSITNYPDGKHRKVELSSGDGYYATNGTYTHIKWKKGDAADSFTFTDTAGNLIKVSAGKSWVCIANKTTCNPTFQ